MKIKSGYKIRKMCGSSVVVAVGKEAADFNGLITLNTSGELLWNRLAQGADINDLTILLVSEYGIDEATALNDVNEFIAIIKGAGFVE